MMQATKKFIYVLLVFFLFSSSYVSAQTNEVSTAVPFLTISPDARAGAMGDIGCATSADPNSQSYNPAKYVFSDNKFGFSFSYSPWLRNLYIDGSFFNLVGYWRITNKDAVGASLRYASYGGINFTDDGVSIIEFRPKEFAMDITYSRKLIDQLSIAITPRFIYSNLTGGRFVSGKETKPGLAGTTDLSLFYNQDFKAKGLNKSTLRAGLCISNIAFMKISYYSDNSDRSFLPANLKFGLGYEMDFDGKNKLAFTGEINKLLVPTNPVYQVDSIGWMMFDEFGNPIIAAGMNPDVSAPLGMIHSFYDAPGGFKEEMQEIIWALGAEYSYRDFVFARLGYCHQSQYKGNRQFFSVGVGIKYNIVGLDVSYLIAAKKYSPLANTLRFTIKFDFVSSNKDEIKQQGRLRTWSKDDETIEQ